MTLAVQKTTLTTGRFEEIFRGWIIQAVTKDEEALARLSYEQRELLPLANGAARNLAVHELEGLGEASAATKILARFGHVSLELYQTSAHREAIQPAHECLSARKPIRWRDVDLSVVIEFLEDDYLIANYRDDLAPVLAALGFDPTILDASSPNADYLV